MVIIGFERSDFTTSDNNEIKGYNVYLSREIAPDRGQGNAVEKVYLTDRKLDLNHIDLNDLFEAEVHIYYNRYGKVERIVPVG